VTAASSDPLSPPPGPTARATWHAWREALAVVCHPPNLRRTLAIAAVVGCVLFVINQLHVVLDHGIDGGTALRSFLNFLVPFCVSNYGLLVGSRRPR